MLEWVLVGPWSALGAGTVVTVAAIVVGAVWAAVRNRR